jgi:hypothetical protein
MPHIYLFIVQEPSQCHSSNKPVDDQVPYRDLSGNLAPLALKAFSGANITIRKDSPAALERNKTHMPPLGYRCPPPHIILGASTDRANKWVKVWLHMKDAWLFYLSSDIAAAPTLSISDWHEMLSLGTLPETYWTNPLTITKQHNLFNNRMVLRQILQNAFDIARQDAPTLDVLPDIHPFVDGHSNIDPLEDDEADEVLSG